MKLTQDEIFTAFDVAVEAGDFDPVGTIARLDITSGLDPNFKKGNRTGLGGLRSEDIERLDINDPTDAAQNFNGVLSVNRELSTQLESNGDVHLAARFGGDILTDTGRSSQRASRFLSKLGRRRSELETVIGKRNAELEAEANKPAIMRELEQAEAMPKASNTEAPMTAGRVKLRKQLKTIIDGV